MIKNLSIILLVVATFIGCQVDDFCTEGTTSNLHIGFYDFEFPDKLKPTDSLTVWATGRDTLYQFVNIDSILIPLDPNNDLTEYHFRSGKDKEDVLIFNYVREEVFISRSCGFKYHFENLQIDEITKTWIHSTVVNNESVTNDIEKHVKILH